MDSFLKAVHFYMQILEAETGLNKPVPTKTVTRYRDW